MNEYGKVTLALTGLTVVFTALTGSFLFNLWGTPAVLPKPPRTDPVFSNPETVRNSLAELEQKGEDTSGFDCYACHLEGEPPQLKIEHDSPVKLPEEHSDLIIYRRNCSTCHEKGKAVELEYDEDFNVIMPKGHSDLAMRHGRNNRNNNCFNCHDPKNLTLLHTREGRSLKLEESNLLCAGCHGPKYRDWQAGIHGRTTGYWDRASGPSKQEDCTACHDPHAPIFPAMIPGPKPHPLHNPEDISGKRGGDH